MAYSLSEAIKTQIHYSGKQPEIINFYIEIHNDLSSAIGDIDLERYYQDKVEIPNNYGGFWVLKINKTTGHPNWDDLDNQIREILKNKI